MPQASTYNATRIAEALSASCAASLDLAEALRAGSISPADNIGSGETAKNLLEATSVALASIQRIAADDLAAIRGQLFALGVAAEFLGYSSAIAEGGAA
jgi:hypothetical protein